MIHHIALMTELSALVKALFVALVVVGFALLVTIGAGWLLRSAQVRWEARRGVAALQDLLDQAFCGVADDD